MLNIPGQTQQLTAELPDVINSAEQQEILNNLLFIGMEDCSLDNKLKRALKGICTASWIGNDAELALFMLYPETKSNVLKAQHNMDNATRIRCLDQEFRDQICLETALSGHSHYKSEVIISGSDKITKSGQKPYYSIPVKSGHDVIAVLILFLEAGHTQDIRETFYLRTVANILHYIIDLFKTEEHIRQLQHYDPLTKIASKQLLKSYLTKKIAHLTKTDNKLAVMFLNLDGLKRINGSLGYKSGDEVLMTIAQRLEASKGNDGLISRWSGDEFAIVLPDVTLAKEVADYMSCVLHNVETPISIKNQKQIVMSCSMGVSVYPADGKDAMTLIQNAAIAMHKAKGNGGNCFQYFTTEMNEAVIERLSIETGLRSALELNQFEMFYQPLIDNQTRQITGAEALIRWVHPVKGIISPDNFIPVAEDSGLILPMGEWALYTACKQCKSWQQSGHKKVKISVNLSAIQFRDNNLCNTVSQILHKTGLDPAQLTLELTESAIMENIDDTLDSLHKLKTIGVSLSIDDFGTGYSSLAYLKRFPIDKLKIDRSFVQDVDINADDKSIVKSIIALGHNLNLSIVAEGVEKPEHMHMLGDLKCEESQGYYISKPLPEDQLMEFFKLWQQSIDTEAEISSF